MLQTKAWRAFAASHIRHDSVLRVDEWPHPSQLGFIHLEQLFGFHKTQ